MKTALQGISAVAITTDAWTSLTTDNYVTVTCHYIEKWSMKSIVLQTRASAESHTGVNLSESLKAVVQDWGLDGKVTACVHDNASNIVLANSHQFVTWESLPCFVHTLQLAINDGMTLTEVDSVVEACNKLVGHFHRSSLATNGLRDKQNSLNIPVHRLIQSCKTRWNSVCDMFERLYEQRQAVSAVLADRSICKLKDEQKFAMERNQWQVIEDIIPVLQALKCATTVLGAETNVCCSLILPVTHGLLSRHLQVSQDDSRLIADFKTTVSGSLERRILSSGDVNIPLITAALDPRHKQLQFLGPAAHQRVHDKLVELIDQHNFSPPS